MVRPELTRFARKSNRPRTMNKLSKLSELTTVTVTLQERKDYTPPTAPTYGSKVSDTFKDSTDAVAQFFTTVSLALVGIVPWLPLILVGLAVPFFALRWLIRWSNRQAAIAVVPPAENTQA